MNERAATPWQLQYISSLRARLRLSPAEYEVLLIDMFNWDVPHRPFSRAEASRLIERLIDIRDGKAGRPVPVGQMGLFGGTDA